MVLGRTPLKAVLPRGSGRHEWCPAPLRLPYLKVRQRGLLSSKSLQSTPPPGSSKEAPFPQGCSASGAQLGSLFFSRLPGQLGLENVPLPLRLPYSQGLVWCSIPLKVIPSPGADKKACAP